MTGLYLILSIQKHRHEFKKIKLYQPAVRAIKIVFHGSILKIKSCDSVNIILLLPMV